MSSHEACDRSRGKLPETAECTMNHNHGRQRCVRESRIVHCMECPTGYEFSLEECVEFGAAAIVTKRMDLGEGRSILDPKWLSHLSINNIASDAFREVSGSTGRRSNGGDPVRSNFVFIKDSFGPPWLPPILPLKTAKSLSVLPRLRILRARDPSVRAFQISSGPYG